MDHDDFVGAVQNRAELASGGEAVRASRAVLTTLGERLQEGEASDLAGTLPMEIDVFLEWADSDGSFGYDEFVERVAERANADEADAAFYAQAVTDVVGEAVPDSELQDVADQLPEEYGELFDLVGVQYY